MIDVPDDNPKPVDRNDLGRFVPGNSYAIGRRPGSKNKLNNAKLTKIIHELVRGTIGRRGQRARARMITDGVDVEGLTDAECWIDGLDEDQLLKVLTHLLPKGVELSALGEDGETVRPVIVMYGTKKYEAAITGDNGDD